MTGYRRDARERTAGEWSGVFGGWVRRESAVVAGAANVAPGKGRGVGR